MRTTKTSKVLEHLQTKGHITSMEAIELYGATRLAATIFCLRKKYDIRTLWNDGTDRYGNTMRYAIYYYKGEIA